MQLNVSIVTYKSDPIQFERTLQCLCRAVQHTKDAHPSLAACLYVVDNDQNLHSNAMQADIIFAEVCLEAFDQVRIRRNSHNQGYGRAHNMAIFDDWADYNLILNPDVLLATDALTIGLDHLLDNEDAVMIAPCGVGAAGEPLHLCKRFPTVADLLLRAFAPAALHRYFSNRLAAYEMRGLQGAHAPVTDIPIMSGCCMLWEGSALRAIGGFDEDYFLYFEDFDLSLRLGHLGKKVYLPAMRIVHFGGHASRKGLLHILFFVRSAIRFYNHHGWRWFH